MKNENKHHEAIFRTATSAKYLFIHPSATAYFIYLHNI